ncbi:glycosyltransferase [Microbacterium sp. SD291]|uniref:glycosyltransferase n=1 Tax=Microbacterium sp. SD291 TaxID=2782007 RepID=UPI001A95B75C|nr:glycosyltransferase [Microbacterium sp. SD291]MBO0979389.1 glycosyltransferase [Microbacterium sp. SD291]
MTSLSRSRVTVVSRIFSPEPGAASFRLAALTRALLECGAEVDVLTSTAPAGMRVAGDVAGATVRRAPVLRDRDGYVRGYAQYMSFDVPLAFRLLSSRKPHAVIVEPPPTTGAVVRAVCWFRRIPYVYYAADVWSEAASVAGSPALVTNVVRALEKFALSGAAGVAAVSESVAQRLREIAPKALVEVVGNGYDETIFRPDGPSHRADAPYLLYPGTASEVHGAMIFIDAMPRVLSLMPDARLVFIGQGAERDAMQARATATVPGAVEFLPRMSGREVAGWIRGAAATLASVLPNAYVAFPTKMLASVGCGTRVVYTGPEPGLSFARTPGVGWTAEYTKDEVAEAMISALREAGSDGERRRLSTWASGEHSLGVVMSRVTGLVQDVIRNARR